MRLVSDTFHVASVLPLQRSLYNWGEKLKKKHLKCFVKNGQKREIGKLRF